MRLVEVRVMSDRAVRLNLLLTRLEAVEDRLSQLEPHKVQVVRRRRVDDMSSAEIEHLVDTERHRVMRLMIKRDRR